MPLELMALCEDISRLAKVIEAPQSALPKCGGRSVGGYHLALNESGTAYILTYQEKSDVFVLAQSQDTDTVMEAVFVEVTRNMTPPDAHGDEPIDPSEIMKNAQSLTWEEITTKAEALDRRWIEHQEALLARLNLVWRDRQVARNTELLKQKYGVER